MSFAQDLERSGKWILATIIMFFALHNAGVVEGIILPPVSIVELTVTKDVDSNGWAEVNGNFTKNRNCTLHTLEWFWKGERGATRVPTLRTTTPIREKGEHSFKDLQIHMPYDQVKEHSYAIAYHECHPLWKTQTKFYP